MQTRKLSRRQFLVASAASVAVIAGGAVGVTKLTQPTGGDTPATYYASHQKAIMASFDETLNFMRPFLAAKFGDADADAVAKETRLEYAALIPQLPYIGGDANELTSNLSQSAGALAFYRVLKARGHPVEEVGEILYKGYEAQMANNTRLGIERMGHTPVDGAGRRAGRKRCGYVATAHLPCRLGHHLCQE